MFSFWSKKSPKTTSEEVSNIKENTIIRDGDSINTFEISTTIKGDTLTEVLKIKTSPNNTYLVETHCVSKSMSKEENSILQCDAFILKAFFKNNNGALMLIGNDKTSFCNGLLNEIYWKCKEGYIVLYVRATAKECSIILKTSTNIHVC